MLVIPQPDRDRSVLQHSLTTSTTTITSPTSHLHATPFNIKLVFDRRCLDTSFKEAPSTASSSQLNLRKFTTRIVSSRMAVAEDWLSHSRNEFETFPDPLALACCNRVKRPSFSVLEIEKFESSLPTRTRLELSRINQVASHHVSSCIGPLGR